MNAVIQWVVDNKWYVLFFLWGLPLGYYRSKFRKKVYGTDSWTINIKPLFLRELKALFGDLYPGDQAYRKLRNFYRLYLAVYVALFAAWLSPLR